MDAPINLKSESLYLDLMKKVLTFTLWQEPPIPAATLGYPWRTLQEKLAIAIAQGLSRITKKYQIVINRAINEQDRIEGNVWPSYAHSMIGLKRLDDIQSCIEQVLRDGIEGDLIETGVWRGGASIFMRAVLAAYAVRDRKVFVADSFAGLPGPDLEKYPQDKGDLLHKVPYLAVSKEEVEENFRKYSLLDDQVVFLKGWFKDTIPNAPIKKLSILRLDGDMYGSTIEVLENLYPKLSKGGYCLIDDYGLEGCRKAVDDFRAKNSIDAKMRIVDWTGRSWRKL